MYKEVDPKTTSRAFAFDMWINAEMPMVTLFKTLNVTPLIKASKKYGYKFNMLMCYCILQAAKDIPEFYLLPTKGKLLQYDKICASIVANTYTGGINFCYVPILDDLATFNKEYIANMQKVYQTNQSNKDEVNDMCIGTSALPSGDIDGAVNMYCSTFTNPFFVWGKYRKKFRRVYLPLTYQFHHVQMDGQQAVKFLNELQSQINKIK